jgi:hypothetical protein
MAFGQRNFIDADNFKGLYFIPINFGLDMPVEYALYGALPKIVLDADVLNSAIDKG